MGSFLILFFLTLIILAAFLRADFVLIVLYLLAGAYVVSHWWSRRAISALHIRRDLPERAFLDEIVDVRLTAKNNGVLPIIWAHLRETLPLELVPEGLTQEVVFIGARGVSHLDYRLDCQKRGYYPVGPLKIFTGDILGMSRMQTNSAPADYLTVFPKIIPLTHVDLPTYSPLGTLRHTQPIYEDPARVRGKRDYILGDSLRRVDWKASAVAHRLQVKQLEPSIALETMIFLNLNRAEIEIKDLYRATELGIVAAASLANWVTQARQAVGLATNGVDPLNEHRLPMVLPARRGQANLMHILEILARVQHAETIPLVQLIQQEAVHLPWGAALIVVANRIEDGLFDALFQARRRGLNASLIVCGFVENINLIQSRATNFQFPVAHLMTEKDLDIWRG
jgi:uncharacterized protein (DUF58 family)